MNLEFNGKLPEKEVIERARAYGKIDNFSGNSILFSGDNFIGLSKLFNTIPGSIDLIYIDPPYNTNQIFSISDSGRCNTISRTKGGTVAYSDEMTKEEYLEFLRERLILMRELLSDEGSIYLHIDTKIGHYVKIMMDEIFGENNFRNDITRIKSNPKNFDRKAFGNEKDVIFFYTKNNRNRIWNEVRIPITDEEMKLRFPKVDKNGRRYTTVPLHAPGETNGVTGKPWRGINPPAGRHWRMDPKEFEKMDANGLIEWSSNGNPRIIRFADENKGKKIQDVWIFKDPPYPKYPTEKNVYMINLIIKQSSKENSIVMDCFAGSGSTLVAARANGRKWIGMDASDIAIKTIEQRSIELGKFVEISLEDK